MPFLNDMLQQSQRRQKQEDALAQENTSDCDVLQAHMKHQTELQSRFRFDVDAVMNSLRGEILGQNQALNILEDMLKVVRADLGDPRRPLFIALFLGPTGVGKTEIVRALARAIHGDADAFCRVDMNTLSQEHYAASLTGAPPGYVGAKEGTTILDQDKLEGTLERPGIVLFDEIEKANTKVVQTLLNVFDNGVLTVTSGERTYNFRNTLIFMTSNLGAREIQRYDARRSGFLGSWLPKSSISRHHDVEKLAESELLKAFAPEFVNRIDSTVTFNWIELNVVEQLVTLEVHRLNRRLMKHRCNLSLDQKVLSHLASCGFDRKFGARSLRRSIRRYLEVPLAAYLLEHHQPVWQNDTPTKYLAILESKKVVFVPV